VKLTIVSDKEQNEKPNLMHEESFEDEIQTLGKIWGENSAVGFTANRRPNPKGQDKPAEVRREMTEEKKRYEVKYGKYGAYFHDKKLNRDLYLLEVQDLLNICNRRKR